VAFSKKRTHVLSIVETGAGLALAAVLAPRGGSGDFARALAKLFMYRGRA